MTIKLEVSLNKLWFFSGLIFLLLLLVRPQASFAQWRTELTPYVSIGELFDDNLYLDSTDEKSDYITTVTPGLNLKVLSEHSQLELAYAPTFVWYAEEDQNDTVRHLGNITYGQDLSQQPDVAAKLSQACQTLKSHILSPGSVSQLTGRLKRRVVLD